MTIKLLMVDLDDTLLGADIEISAANRRALAEASRLGVSVTLASGRMFSSMRPYAEELGIEMPLIAYNGALARPLTGTDLWHHPLDSVTALEILDHLSAKPVVVNLYLNDRLYVREMNQRVTAYGANARVQATPVGDLAAFLGAERPTKMLAIGEPALLKQLCPALGTSMADRAEISLSKPHYLEIMAPGISKGAALRLLLRHLGLNASEVMAIGDGPNDLDMLRTAGIGVAVGNAPPEVLAGVKYVVSSSDHDGVAEAVEKFILSPA